MRAIPQLLIIFGLFCALAVYFRFRSRTVDRLVASVVFALGALAVAVPDSLTVLSQSMGIGRGADLILYSLGTAGIFLFTMLYAKAVRVERQVTQLARQVAVQSAQKPAP